MRVILILVALLAVIFGGLLLTTDVTPPTQTKVTETFEYES